MSLTAYVREARPHQFLKNTLVFAAPGAAGVLTTYDGAWRSVVAFVAMSLAAAGIYYLNDIADVDCDRLHPTKRSRPIASGEITIGAGRLVAAALLAASLAVGCIAGLKLTLVVAAYLLLTLSYNVTWKHIAVIDMIAVAAGFFLRAAAGAAATGVAMSSWFILVTVFGSLFIVAAKRLAEARQLGAAAGKQRATLAAYTPEFLRFTMGVACASAVIAYSTWAFESVRAHDHALPMYEASVAPFLAGLLRYTLVVESGGGAAPEDVFFADRVLQILGLLWITCFGLAVYL